MKRTDSNMVSLRKWWLSDLVCIFFASPSIRNQVPVVSTPAAFVSCTPQQGEWLHCRGPEASYTDRVLIIIYKKNVMI